MKSFLLSLCLLGCCMPLWAQQHFYGVPFIENYSTQTFGGGIQSWGFAQDSREVLYVANNFGLLQYNGSSWEAFPVKNGTKVRSLYIDQADVIYIGCQADFGYFSPNAKGLLEYTSLADSLAGKFRNFDEVWRIYPLNGHIYFFTFKNIFRYTPGKGLRVIAPDGGLEFSFLANKTLYSQESRQGLSYLKDTTLHPLPGGHFFLGKQVVSILPFEKNSFLIFTNKHGIFHFDGHEAKPFHWQLPSSIPQTPIINQAIMLHDGQIAVGTQDYGLILLTREGHVPMLISKENGLQDRTVHSLYQDNHQNLWLGLNNGIAQVELSSPFSLLDGKVGLAGTGYAAIQEEGTLYLGTNNGLFSRELNNRFASFQPILNSNGQVYHLNKINGHLLMGHHNGAFYLKDGIAHALGSPPGAWAFIAHPEARDKIIVGSYSGLSLLESRNEQLQFSRSFSGFDESSRILAFDKEGRLWMAHGYKGIFSFDFNTALDSIREIHFYNSRKGFPSDQLINMEEVRNELIFPASVGVFSYQAESDSFVINTKYSHLFGSNEHIVEMEEDILGNIYFITGSRVGRLSFDAFGKAEIDESVFNKIKDKLNDDLSYIHVIDPQDVLFGAKDGFIHYQADKVKSFLPFHTHLSYVYNTSGETDSLLMAGRSIITQGLKLPYDLNSLRLEYTATYFEDADKTQYSYYLKNFDQGWSDWGANTEKEYTNLPEGTYVFHLKARNVYGKESTAEPFTFTIRPPFYRSTWAYVIYVVSAFTVLSLVIFQIDKRYQKERKFILMKQQRELNQKDHLIKDLTDKTEQEIVKLKNEKLQSEIDHMNRELTSSTIHLINKNEVMGSVRTHLEDILKKNERSGFSEELRRIIKSIDHNINSDGDWKQFELHFNHVHGDFTKRLVEAFPQLTPQEIKLSAYLRLNLNTKEIAQLLSISVRGVEISRYRLRKKLNLDRNENLTEFILKF